MIKCPHQPLRFHNLEDKIPKITCTFNILQRDIKKFTDGISMVVQWLTLHAPNAGGLGPITGQGARSHMPQLKIPSAATKIQHSRKKKKKEQCYIKKKSFLRKLIDLTFRIVAKSPQKPGTWLDIP